MPTDNKQVCELKSQFCDGKDVRRIQKIWAERCGASRINMRGSLHYWCKGCRDLHNGGFRYPKPGE